MTNVGIDLDQVLADFSAAFDEFHDITYGSNLRSTEQEEFFISKIFDITKEEELRRVREFYSTKYFRNMKPFSDSVECIKKLSKKYNLFVITARPEFTTTATLEWIEKYYPNSIKEVIITSHYFGGTKKKSEVCVEKKIDIMIEDMIHYANDCATVCKIVFLLKRSWNQKGKVPKNVIRVDDWKEIYLKLSN